MIVVDTNVIAYLYLPGPWSDAAEELYLRDSDWVAPRLWRSEFRNVLITYVRKKLLGVEEAVEVQRRAEALMASGEYDVGSFEVLQLAGGSSCSAYDAEFVALAEYLDVPLVTADARLSAAFPDRAASL